VPGDLTIEGVEWQIFDFVKCSKPLALTKKKGNKVK
jgi:hypothetical protein